MHFSWEGCWQNCKYANIEVSSFSLTAAEEVTVKTPQLHFSHRIQRHVWITLPNGMRGKKSWGFHTSPGPKQGMHLKTLNVPQHEKRSLLSLKFWIRSPPEECSLFRLLCSVLSVQGREDDPSFHGLISCLIPPQRQSSLVHQLARLDLCWFCHRLVITSLCRRSSWRAQTWLQWGFQTGGTTYYVFLSAISKVTNESRGFQSL